MTIQILKGSRLSAWLRLLFGPCIVLDMTSLLAANDDGSQQMSIDPAGPNSIVFAPVEARFVRVDVAVSRGREACFDELEVYGPTGGENLALVKAGASATASSCLEGYASHRIEHLNDGQYGNARSWICGQKEGWAQIELPVATTVDCVVFSRDRTGRYQDRVPSRLSVSTSLDGENWERVAAIDKTYPVKLESAALLPNRPVELNLPLQSARNSAISIGPKAWRRRRPETSRCALSAKRVDWCWT